MGAHQSAPGRARTLPDRRFSGRGRTGYLGGLGARERLPQAVDGAGETLNLFGQPLGVILLRREKTLYRQQLVLHHLQLVDRLLLRRLQALGFLNQLFGGLGRARLQLTGKCGAILPGRCAGVGAPQRDRSDPNQNDDEASGSQSNRLSADTCDAAGPCITRYEFYHANSKRPTRSESSRTHDTCSLASGIRARIWLDAIA